MAAGVYAPQRSKEQQALDEAYDRGRADTKSRLKEEVDGLKPWGHNAHPDEDCSTCHDFDVLKKAVIDLLD